MSRKRPCRMSQEEGNGGHHSTNAARKRSRGLGVSTSTSKGMDVDSDALDEGEDEGGHEGGEGDPYVMSHQQMAGGRRGPHALSERYTAHNPQPRY
jgi:hypothetical protein